MPKKAGGKKANAAAAAHSAGSGGDDDDDEGELCAVCLDGSSSEDNNIVFCDECNVAVHQSCYGVSKIPQGDQPWFCRVCEKGYDGRTAKCCLCGHGGGALKETTKGGWCHVQCATWLPDPLIVNRAAMEPIDCTLLNTARNTLKCCICKNSKMGPCIQCPVGKCHISFHPWCLHYIDHPDIYVPSYELTAYCRKHTPMMLDADMVKPNFVPFPRPKKFATDHSQGFDSGAIQLSGGPGKRGPTRPAHPKVKVREESESKSKGVRASLTGLSKLMRTAKKQSEGGSGGTKVRGESAPSSASVSGSQSGRSMHKYGTPCFSEWPGQQMGEEMDLEHYWNVIGMYFPEDHDMQWVGRIREALVPVKGNDPVLRFPRVKKALGKSLSRQSSSAIQADEEDGDADDSVWDQETGHVSDVSYETDDDTFSLVSQGPSTSASLEELNPQEVTKLLGGKVKVLMESVDHPQACLFECKTRQDGEEGLAPVELSLTTLRDLPATKSKGYSQSADTRVEVEMVETTEVDLELMMQQHQLKELSKNINREMGSMLEAIGEKVEEAAAERARRQEVEENYLKLSQWKHVACCLQRGMKDQKPDFNKTKLEAIPASWTVPVEGRPKLLEEEDEEEDDSICMVCFDGTHFPGQNEIVFCEGCNAAVHQACYGLSEIPDGDFFCDKCCALQDNPNRAIDCALCTEIHGGFKRTTDGSWVHLVCAMWCPRATIQSVLEMGPVDLSNVVFTGQDRQISNTSPKPALPMDPAELPPPIPSTIDQPSQPDIPVPPQVTASSSSEIQPTDDKDVTDADPPAAEVPSEAVASTETTTTDSAPTSTEPAPTSTDTTTGATVTNFPAVKCVYCNDSRGYTIRCCHDECPRHFHFLCAWFAGAYLSLEVTDKTYGGPIYPSGLVFEALCLNHSPVGKTDRAEQIRIRNKYRLREDEKRVVHKKRLLALDGGMRGMAGKKDLAPDSFDKYACAICFKPRSPLLPGDSQQMEPCVACAKCGLSVHSSCYSDFHGTPPGGDEGSWVCELCRLDPQSSCSDPPACVLCPRRGGVMAATNDRNFRWAHLFCTMNNGPAVFRAGKSVAIPGTVAVDVRSLTREKSNKAKCTICSRKQGPCISCSGPDCGAQFHPLCAKVAGWLFDVDDKDRRLVYCPACTPDGVFRGFNGEFFDLLATQKLRRNLDRARILMDLTRRREKLKRSVWRADCDLSESRLSKLTAYVHSKIQELQSGGRRSVLEREAMAVQLRQELSRAASPIQIGKARPMSPPPLPSAEAARKGARSPMDGVLLPGSAKKKVEAVPLVSSVVSPDVGKKQARPSKPATSPVPVLPRLTERQEEKLLREQEEREQRERWEKAKKQATPSAPIKKQAAPVLSSPPVEQPKSHSKKRQASPDAPRPSKHQKKEEEEGDEEEEEEEFNGIRERFEDLAEVQAKWSVKKLQDDRLWSSAAQRLDCGRVDFEKSLTVMVGREELRKLDKWRKPSTSLSDASRGSLDRQLLEMVVALEECTDAEGRDVSLTFDVAPDPGEYPEYYEAVDYPMDLETLRHRVQTFFYDSVQEFNKDVRLLIRNAKDFNAPKSQAYLDAEQLRQHFEACKSEILGRDHHKTGGGASSSNSVVTSDGEGAPATRSNKRRRTGGDGGMASSDDMSTRDPSPTPIMSNKRGGRAKNRRKKGGPSERGCDVCAGRDKWRKLCEGCVTKYARNLLGARLQVYWPEDKSWYSGALQDYDEASGHHRVLYDDGEWEFVKLHEQEVAFLTDVSLEATSNSTGGGGGQAAAATGEKGGGGEAAGGSDEGKKGEEEGKAKEGGDEEVEGGGKPPTEG